MYRTRSAADSWQSEYSSALSVMGFDQGSKHIVVSVHGDNFTAAGPKFALYWFEAAMREKYKLPVGGRLGPGPSDSNVFSYERQSAGSIEACADTD